MCVAGRVGQCRPQQADAAAAQLRRVGEQDEPPDRHERGAVAQGRRRAVRASAHYSAGVCLGGIGMLAGPGSQLQNYRRHVRKSSA